MLQWLYINTKHLLKKTIFIVPFCCLGYSLFSSYYRLQCGDVNVTSNSFGYSLVIDFSLLYLYWFTGKYCLLTKIAVISMILINIMCITKEFFSIEFYTFWYQVLINSIVMFLGLIFKITKK